MKKLTCILLAALLALSVSGCAKKEAGGVEGTTSEIIDKIYANHASMDLHVDTIELDVTDADAVAYNTGLTSGEKLSQASVSEAMMSQAYSLVVLRVKNAADAAQVARDVYDNVNTRKQPHARRRCGVVVLFMVDSGFDDVATVESIQEAFKVVCNGNVTIVG